MKKFTILIFSLVIFSCGSSKHVSKHVSKHIKVEKKEITGSWLIEDITDNNNKKLSNDSLLLNDVSLACFFDSIWKFDPGTNSGQYNINDLYCKFGKRAFSFHSQEVNETDGYYKFSLKTTHKKGKKITGTTYDFKLIKLSNMTMKWECNLLLNNKATAVNINFKKKNKPNVTNR